MTVHETGPRPQNPSENWSFEEVGDPALRSFLRATNAQIPKKSGYSISVQHVPGKFAHPLGLEVDELGSLLNLARQKRVIKDNALGSGDPTQRVTRVLKRAKLLAFLSLAFVYRNGGVNPKIRRRVPLQTLSERAQLILGDDPLKQHIHDERTNRTYTR